MKSAQFLPIANTNYGKVVQTIHQGDRTFIQSTKVNQVEETHSFYVSILVEFAESYGH